jgi:hypothetical protein
VLLNMARCDPGLPETYVILEFGCENEAGVEHHSTVMILIQLIRSSYPDRDPASYRAFR